MIDVGIRPYRVGFSNDFFVFRYEWRYSIDGKRAAFLNFWRFFKQRWWRRSYWWGWMVVWDYPPHGLMVPERVHSRSRRRALKRYGRRLVKENLNHDYL